MLTLRVWLRVAASELVRLRGCDIDSKQMIIRVVQSGARKDRHVMLPAEILALLRRWWKARPTRRMIASLVRSFLVRGSVRDAAKPRA